ncbi:unnamed protein product [Amaranthus hypochondriacus]
MYVGEVPNDSLSPQHLRDVAPDARTGLELFAKLTIVPITTKSEYETKIITNVDKGLDNDNLNNMDGCTAHRIKDYGFIYGDYRKGKDKQEQRRNELSRFRCIRDKLQNNGPVYACIRFFKYGDRIDRSWYYYTSKQNEKINKCEKYHAITIMGWGNCKFVQEGNNNIINGCEEVYWLGKNNWGAGSPPNFVRVNTDLVKYIIHPVV